MDSSQAVVAAAVITSLPGWAAFARSRATRRAIDQQTTEIQQQRRAMDQQTTELKDHITATAGAAAMNIPPAPLREPDLEGDD